MVSHLIKKGYITSVDNFIFTQNLTFEWLIYFWIWPRKITRNDPQLIIIIVKENSWKPLRELGLPHFTSPSESGTWIRSVARFVGTYIFFFPGAHRRIRSSRHGWNKPWLAELLVIRTTKRGSVACGPNRTGIFCKHVIVNTRRNGALKCGSSNPPRGHAAPISGTENSYWEGMAQVSSRSILERKESLLARQ